MDKPIIRENCFAVYCEEDNGVMFYLGALCFGIHATPKTGRKYAITIFRMNEDIVDEEMLTIDFKLTKEEYATARRLFNSMPDSTTPISVCVAKRVARDIFTFFLMSLNCEVGDMEERYNKEWEDYTKELIHEHM